MRTLNPIKIISLTLAWICLSFASTLQAQVADVLLQGTDFNSDEWIDPFQPISFRLTHVPGPSRGRLAFFIGANDVTGLMKPVAPGVFKYQASLAALPAGENELKLYLVHDNNEWTELTSLSLRVLTAAGFEESEITPRVEFSDAFQSAKARSDFEPDDDWHSHNEVSLQAGLDSRFLRKDLEIQSSWNFTGSSVQEQALRFSEKGDDAAKIDLSDYLIEVRKGEAGVQLGHVAYGSHPLLMDNVSNRGVTASWRAFERFDMSLSAQNGQSITGGANLLGLTHYDKNRINGLGFGLDVLADSESQLRIELTYIDAKITAEDNFNFGEVTDAELSSGFGIVIRGNSASGRLRGDIAFARSTFQNPVDPFLQQDFDLVESDESTDNSRSAKLEYDIIQPSYDEGSTTWSLTASLSHSLTDPFYNSVGAFITPDVEDNGLAFSGQAGEVSWQAQFNESRDNLDDIPTVLTTVNRNTVISISLPFKTLFNSESGFIPDNVNIDVQRNHQFGDNLPTSFDADTHIPDQLTLQQSVGLEWQISQSSLSYNFSKADQDNRQNGREDADFINTEHALSVNTSVNDNISINLSVGRSKAEDIEQSLDRMSSSASLGVDWLITDALSVSLNLSKSSEDDSDNLATSDSDSAQAQLSYQFDLPGGSAGKLPVQAFLRYSSDENKSVDNQFDFASSSENQAINAGLNISFF